MKKSQWDNPQNTQSINANVHGKGLHMWSTNPTGMLLQRSKGSWTLPELSVSPI